MVVKQAALRARFAAQKMGKADLARGTHLFAGLNAFEAGQIHEPHAHCDRDKLYVVLEGRGELTIGEETTAVERGDVALAAADVVHSLRNPGPARLVVLTVMAPPATGPDLTIAVSDKQRQDAGGTIGSEEMEVP